MDTDKAYLEQWERVKRWWTRFAGASRGQLYLGTSEFYEDDIFAFFLNCYHLKDWIKNDPTSGDLKDLVEPYIKQSEALSICADLCNGLKHFSRDPRRGRKNAKFGSKTEKISMGKDAASVAISYTIITDSGTFDAFDIAQQCLLDGEIFFQKNNKGAA